MNPVLSCKDLTVTYSTGARPVQGVSFAVAPGECFALVGGSGAGKSTIAKALVGLHHKGTSVSGSLALCGQEMAGAEQALWQKVRGRDVGFVAQNPWASCNPLRAVQDHVAEAWKCHGFAVTMKEVEHRLDGLGVANAGARMAQHPHTWSGGMLQRASIAAAGALAPPVIIADEPTSALDADRAEAVLQALRALGSAVVLISHDIGLVLRNADQVGVLHDGQLVEIGTPTSLTETVEHPETRRLLAALKPLPPRKAKVEKPILNLSNVSASHNKGRVRVLEAADLEISAGEIVGVQGPSGCGKSTLLRLAMGIEQPSGGKIWRAEELQKKGATAPVFQDPVGSLVPHWPIWRSVTEPLTTSRKARRKAAESALAKVGLAKVDLEARPGELSIGQCQRVALARATIVNPALIVADEPTSALDSPSTWLVSKLLRDAAERGSAVLVVSHDEGFLSQIADRIVRVMEGRILTR